MKSSEEFIDHYLVKCVRAGDQRAFEALVRRHERLVYTFALLTRQDPRSAEELTLATFLTALENISQFSGSQAFPAWLLSIAAREAQHISDSPRRDCNFFNQSGSGKSLELRTTKGDRCSG